MQSKIWMPSGAKQICSACRSPWTSRTHPSAARRAMRAEFSSRKRAPNWPILSRSRRPAGGARGSSSSRFLLHSPRAAATWASGVIPRIGSAAAWNSTRRSASCSIIAAVTCLVSRRKSSMRFSGKRRMASVYSAASPRPPSRQPSRLKNSGITPR